MAADIKNEDIRKMDIKQKTSKSIFAAVLLAICTVAMVAVLSLWIWIIQCEGPAKHLISISSNKTFDQGFGRFGIPQTT